MKKSIHFLSAIVIFLLLTPTLFSNMAGSPGAKTGSPIDGNNCTACHNATVNSGNGMLSVMTNIPTQGYNAGQQYSITVQLSQSNINRFGFEITCEEGSFSMAKAGTFMLTDQTNTQFANNSTSITHTMNGINGTNMKIWTMDWIAPTNANGGVVFYVAAVAANANNNNNGDEIYTTSRSFFEATSSVSEKQNNITVFVNPTSNNIMINSTYEAAIKSIKMFDASGKLVLNENEILLPTILNVDFLSAGIYMINMQDSRNGKTITKKVVLP
ncbi:MAG: T9SS type A sorting domain-containing protein [Flavobacteriales bacterium]|nr:T9SS type A sorting domain-containing protein [Flavobacteriales bacterium]